MNLGHKIPIRKLSLPWIVEVCTIDESIKGAASLRRYGITFDGNIDIMYPFPKLGWTKGCKALPRVVWKNDAAFVILTCLPENDKKLFYVIFPHEKLGFIPLALPIAQFKFKCIIFFWKFRKKASFQSIKYEQVSYWPNLKLHNCLYPSNGFYMGDSEGMALECEPNGLSIAGQYQCLFWVYSSNLPILDCTIWTSKNVSNYHKF